MPSLPLRLTLEQLQNQWAAIINPFLSAPISNGQLLSQIAISDGTTVINHKLGRKLQGWIIVGLSASASIYDNQNINPTPNLTLSLTSSATCTVSLWVF